MQPRNSRRQCVNSVLLDRMLLVPGVAQVWYPKLSTGILPST